MNPEYPRYDFRNLPTSESPTQLGLLSWATHWQQCTQCSISGASQSRVVVGEGSPKSHALAIGMGPGAGEVVLKRPFIGPAGRIFRSHFLKDIEEMCFVVNLICCRATDGPRNREPANEEIESCLPHITELLEILKPKIVVLFGNLAASAFGIGTRHEWARGIGTPFDDHTQIYSTYHPSFVLRRGGPKARVQDEIIDLVLYHYEVARQRIIRSLYDVI